jgi:hypothetical protein
MHKPSQVSVNMFVSNFLANIHTLKVKWEYKGPQGFQCLREVQGKSSHLQVLGIEALIDLLQLTD